MSGVQGKQKNLVEVCPQCCKVIDSSANRLVHDTCGHLKCRICLLQEITGCLLCGTEENTNTIEYNSMRKFEFNSSNKTKCQSRKSVITSLAIQKAEQCELDNVKFSSTCSGNKDTCHLIKQSFEKDILFPTDIVKRSTGNFYHLKRIFSQRFFNEYNNNVNKKHKSCDGTDKCSTTEKFNNPITEKKNWKPPGHIEVQYYCTIHKVVISEKNSLNNHMTCNCLSEKSNTKLFKCTLCDKGFKVIGKLNRHMKIHTKNSKFKCTECGKSCIDNYALKTHERTHTDYKPYSCSNCDKKFSGLQNFKRHEKKHRNEKNFVCDECGFRFITKNELKRHSVTHTNLKSFTCQICFSKFSFKRTLVRHTKTHDVNLKKIKCLHCDSTFRRKDNLERHLKTSHLELKSEKN